MIICSSYIQIVFISYYVKILFTHTMSNRNIFIVDVSHEKRIIRLNRGGFAVDVSHEKSIIIFY